MTTPKDQTRKEITDGFELGRFTPYRSAVVAQLLSEALAREYRDRFGISIPDWRVLVHLSADDGASVRDIEQKVVMEKSKVSRAASRLVARGLIARTKNETDGRLLHFSLTERGWAMMAELLPLANAFQRRIDAALGNGAEAFEDGLTRLWEEFETQHEQE